MFISEKSIPLYFLSQRSDKQTTVPAKYFLLLKIETVVLYLVAIYNNVQKRRQHTSTRSSTSTQAEYEFLQNINALYSKNTISSWNEQEPYAAWIGRI